MKKKVMVLIILITVFFAGYLIGKYFCNSNFYPMTGEVVNLSEDTDKVTIKDFNGNLWQFKGIEDWTVGDIASCMMYDNHTKDTIEDDEIVDVHYSG